MNKNSDWVQKFFLRGWLRTVPPTQIFPNFWNCPIQVELKSSYLGCKLIHKANDQKLPSGMYGGTVPPLLISVFPVYLWNCVSKEIHIQDGGYFILILQGQQHQIKSCHFRGHRSYSAPPIILGLPVTFGYLICWWVSCHDLFLFVSKAIYTCIQLWCIMNWLAVIY